MQTTYNGNDIFHPYNFGLYGMDDYSSEMSLDWNETKENIRTEFISEHGQAIETELAKYGLIPVKYEYYSPRFYNFKTDSLDLTVKVTNPELYIIATESPEFKARVQKLCDANKSYDGYMSFTPDNADESINKMDAVLMQAILAPVFQNVTEEEASAKIYEWSIYNYACETCNLIHKDIEYYNDKDADIIKKCELETK